MPTEIKGPYWIYAAEGGEFQIKGRNGAIAFRYPADQEQLANAHCARLQKAGREAERRLYAAAADLLAALEAITSPSGFKDLDVGGHGTHGAALAAIAKARGEQA